MPESSSTTPLALVSRMPRTPAPTTPSKSLALDAINALVQLGQIGHFRGIKATLDEIEAASPEYTAAVAELRAIANSFNLSRFLTVLEAQRRTHAP